MPQRGWVAVAAVVFGVVAAAVATRRGALSRRPLRAATYCGVLGVWLGVVAMLSSDVVAAAVAGVLYIVGAEVLAGRGRRESSEPETRHG
jgi:hypothetical protein